MTLLLGDCLAVLPTVEPESVDVIVTDPPYGLEFMGKEWDKLDGAGMAKPGIGERRIPWPAFGGADFGGANATCAICGGRLRGAKKCSCETPEWRVKGEPRERRSSSGRSMQDWHYPWAVEALRVAKPGAHLVAFGGTRTFHRLMVAIEDAGWEIRDCVMWLYGSGFPKSLDVSKAIDKAAGAEREVLGTGTGRTGPAAQPNGGRVHSDDNYQWPGNFNITAPATDAAKQWDGWGTALKPAWEPIILARKPLIGTVAENVLQHGTGGLNVGACRVGTDGGTAKGNPPRGASNGIYGDGINGACDILDIGKGRWPANLILDEDAARLLDAQSGILASGKRRNATGYSGRLGGGKTALTGFSDTGGASRFFYTAKASRAEREAGLDGLPVDLHGKSGGTNAAAQRGEEYDNGDSGFNRTVRVRNGHPTVKPVALMRWLVRLVTPPGGLVLDPFMGSGSTGVAAVLEGFRFTGIEQQDEYMRIAEARIAQASAIAAERLSQGVLAL